MRNLLASRFLPTILIGILIAAAPPPARGEQGTRIDRRTGLTWVADLDFAVHMGFAPATVTTRVQALKLVGAMNRGEIENFGRRDWRIPTASEVATRFRRMAAPQASGASAAAAHAWVAAGAGAWRDLVVAWPVAASATLAGVPAAAVLATNSVLVAKDTTITGNVVANQAAAGPTLEAGFELSVDKNAHIVGAIAADSIKIAKDVVVSSDASYNTLQNQGSIAGPLHTPLALPVFALLPAFHTGSSHPTAPNVTVAAGQTVTLVAGNYGTVNVAAQGNLVLSGGIYDVRSVHLGGNCGFPCARLQFSGPTSLRVAERMDALPFSRIGPLAGSGVSAKDVIVYIAGINGTTGALTATPPAFQVGKNCVVEANLYAPNGSLLVDKDSTVVGALLARDVSIDKNTTVTLSSYFANRAPVAHPQTRTTAGATPIVITLTGQDPEGEDLTFAIVTGPTQGSLGTVVPVEPPADPDPRPGDTPRHTAATVTYTPATAGDLEDSFVFRAQDPHGASGVATVSINPPTQEGGGPPPPTTVVVTGFSETTVQDRAVTLTLSGNAPAGVALTFSIAAGTGPDSGVLSALVQGSESPRRSATTVYTPNTGFLGSDEFDFTACGTISSVLVCASATASIEVVTATPEPTDLAPDLETETSETQPLEITLGSPGATSGASGVGAPSGIIVIARPAAVQIGAAIAGNVADAEPNGFGDNHNALPGAAPVFISASVNQSGGAGSDGTARIHMEWDISSFGAGTLQSATVTLETHRGTIDSLDTFFFAGAGGNGTLEDTDFESSLEGVGAVMPVPSLAEQPVGADGTFTFNVLPELQDALNAGADFFTVQGRVNESTAGSFRGLEVYSTASGNISTFRHPQLAIATPGVTPSIAFTILALPAHGVLRDSLGAAITAVPALLPSSRVTYTANASFVGDDSFGYRAELGAQIDSGLVFVRVRAGNCATDPLFCDPGR